MVGTHFETGMQPILRELDKPLAARNWRPSQATLAAFHAAGQPILEQNDEPLAEDIWLLQGV